MPSSKPVVVIRTNEELIRKLDILAKKEKRSRSQSFCEDSDTSYRLVWMSDGEYYAASLLCLGFSAKGI